MSIELAKLPYEYKGLEPVISKKTIEFHYGKHHLTYVNNLNKLIEGTEFAKSTLEEIIVKANGGIFNNAAQVWNHTFYWDSFKKKGEEKPVGELAEAINKSFGSFDAFKEKFSNAALTLFGAGWAWLVKKKDGTLDIIQESNAGNPLKNGLKPILAFDVWEHAYYIDYHNRRADYIKALWNIINWELLNQRYNSKK